MTNRLKVIVNKNYKRNGMKSYAFLLTKYDFAPTLDGPFRDLLKHVSHKSHHHHHKHPHDTDGAGGSTQQPITDQPATGQPTTGGSSGSNTGGQPGVGTQVSAEDIQNDSEYLVQVSIGTPPQNVLLDFDTGSADLWVWSTELPTTTQTQGKAAGHNIFNPAKSSTFKKQSGSTWNISYGDGSSASGDVGTDVLHLGTINVENQGIELAKILSAEFASGAGDGLLGLAFGSINTVKPRPVATPVENMISQSDIPNSAELFTVYLSSWRDINDPDKGESFYTFGEIDTTVTSQNGQPAYTPIDNSQGFWMFDSNYVTIAGKQIARNGNTAIADTGTTLLLTDDNIVSQIYAQIPGAKYDSTQQGYIFPNNLTVDQYPEIIFPCGDIPIRVMPEDLPFADAGNGMVYGGIQSRGNLTFDILGDTWLKGVYVVFDQGNQRIGVVQRTNDPQNLEPPPSQPTQ